VNGFVVIMGFLFFFPSIGILVELRPTGRRKLGEGVCGLGSVARCAFRLAQGVAVRRLGGTVGA